MLLEGNGERTRSGWSGEAISNLKLWISNVGQRQSSTSDDGGGKRAGPAKFERDAKCAQDALRRGSGQAGPPLRLAGRRYKGNCESNPEELARQEADGGLDGR